MIDEIDRRNLLLAGGASIGLALWHSEIRAAGLLSHSLVDEAAPDEAKPDSRKMPFFHVGMVVEDLPAAMAELTATIGVTWREPHDSRYGEWGIKVVYSIEGPPYIELVQGGAGGPWDTSKGSRIDHIGIWSEDVAKESERLAKASIPVDFDPVSVGKPATFCYHRAVASGVRVEVIDLGARKRIEER